MNRRDFATRSAVWILGAGCASEAWPLFRKKKKQVVMPVQQAAPSVAGAASLRAHGVLASIPVGCAVVPEILDIEGARAGKSADLYTQTVLDQAGILVAENAMKWSALRPSPAGYDFAASDRLFEFAGIGKQLVRGHNLCWHEQLPGWFASVATPENAASLLTQHIQTVAGRYAGRVQSWDVVNEAVHPPDGRPDGLRNSPWLRLLGPGYIEMAFQAAAQADPHAVLTYNDYDIELDTPEQEVKRGQVLLLLRRLHARGIPVGAVGIQSHLQATGPLPGPGLVRFIREVASMGLEAYITEMDVNTHALPGDAAAQDEAVARVYDHYLRLVLPEPNVKACLTWGITDAHTWLNQTHKPWAERPDGTAQRPLPFDDQYRPVKAFYAMRDAIDAARAVLEHGTFEDARPASQEPYLPFVVPGSPTPSSPH
jgi:endo-1,4-beta-xylanase